MQEGCQYLTVGTESRNRTEYTGGMCILPGTVILNEDMALLSGVIRTRKNISCGEMTYTGSIHGLGIYTPWFADPCEQGTLCFTLKRDHTYLTKLCIHPEGSFRDLDQDLQESRLTHLWE